MKSVDDLAGWLEMYGVGTAPARTVVVQFGANSEVEDPLLQLGRPVLVFDDNPERCTVLGAYGGTWENGFSFIKNQLDRHFWIVCGVCSTPSKRASAMAKISLALSGANYIWYGFRAPTAHVSKYASVDISAIILDRAIVMANAVIGRDAVLLPGASVYHYSSVERGSIVVGGAIILGRARIKEYCRICAGAVILPGAIIGPRQTIGAGAVVKMQGDDMEDFMG